jgi:uncharacterized protein GlcG (DUF336 family)
MVNPTPMQPTTSEATARLMIDTAIAEARSLGVPVTIVVVDESGVLKAMSRMDTAPLVSVQTAINKAYAAAAIGMPPDDSTRRSSPTLPPWPSSRRGRGSR